jgi:KTSC domain
MSYTEWQIFDSSAVAAGRYDSIEQTLELQFDSGKVYKYFNVPKSVWLALCRAESKGKFFQNEISEKFRYEIATENNFDSGERTSAVQSSEDVPLDSPRVKSYGTSKENPFHTYNRPLAYMLIKGLHYKNRYGDTFKLIHEAHCLDHGYSWHFEFFIKEKIPLPDLSKCTSRLEKIKLIKEYKIACKGGKAMNFYVTWGNRTNCREEHLPDSLVYIGVDKSYDAELDDESKWWFIEDWSYLEWPDETDDENFPELYHAITQSKKSEPLKNKDLADEVQPLKKTGRDWRSYAHVSYPDAPDVENDYDSSSETTKAGIAYDKETLEKMGEKIRSLKSTMPIIRPEISPETSQKNGCASVIVIGLVTVASLYFI